MNEEEDIVVLSYVTISRILLPDGTVSLEIEQGEASETWDLIGMLQVALDSLRDEALCQINGYALPEDDEDDDY